MLCFSIFETIGVVVDELNGFLEGVNTQNTKHWSKNLLFVGLEILDWYGRRLIRFVIKKKKTANLHVRFHFRDDWRPTEVSIRVAFHLNQGRMKNYEIYSLPWFPFHPIEVPLPHPQQTKTINVNRKRERISTWISPSILAFDAGEMTGGISVLASWPGPTWDQNKHNPPHSC